MAQYQSNNTYSLGCHIAHIDAYRDEYHATKDEYTATRWGQIGCDKKRENIFQTVNLIMINFHEKVFGCLGQRNIVMSVVAHLSDLTHTDLVFNVFFVHENLKQYI